MINRTNCDIGRWWTTRLVVAAGLLVALVGAPSVYAGGDTDRPPCIKLEKQISVDGGMSFVDADQAGDPDVPMVPFPSDALYQLVVKNCGKVKLNPVIIDDSTLGIADVDIGELGIRETRMIDEEAIPQLSVTDRCPRPGTFENEATATGTSVIDGETATATDTAVLVCAGAPEITLLKQISVDGGVTFFDADQAGATDVPTVPFPSEALYQLIVKNTGTVDLEGVTINDPILGIVNFMVPGILLAQDEIVLTRDDISQLFVANRCDSAGTFENVAAVIALPVGGGDEVSDDDPAFLICTAPEEVCELGVVASCLVTPPPAGDLLCEDKIAATLLSYTGPEILGADVEFEGDKVGFASYTNVDLIPGTILSSASQNGYTIDAQPDELGSKTTIRINGVEEIIHTSCSAIYEVGQPAPLDGSTPNPSDSDKGDPSPNWFVEGFVDKDGAVVMLPSDPVPASACEVTTTPPPHCDGKVELLGLRYIGGDCTIEPNDQEGKVECSGDAGDAGPVELVMTKDADKITVTPSGESIGLGDVVTIERNDGKELASDTTFEIRQGGATLQSLEIHTSCSKPLNLGDRFGGVEVITLATTKGGLAQQGGEVKYFYEVSNIGDVDVINVDVMDGLGAVPGSSIDSLPTAGEPVTLMTDAFVDMDFTNTVVVTGETASGAMCEARDSTTVTLVEPPLPSGSCDDGKPVALIFEYTGDDCTENTTNTQEDKLECSGDPNGAAPVQVVMTKDADKTIVTPSDGSIGLGGLVTITREDGKSLGSDTEFDIRQGGTTLQSLGIHTSCSKELNEGDQFGSMILRQFVPETK